MIIVVAERESECFFWPLAFARISQRPLFAGYGCPCWLAQQCESPDKIDKNPRFIYKECV